MGLVFRIDIIAEGLRRLVEDHRKMRGLLVGAGFLEQLPQHVAEALDGANRQPVALAGQWRQRVIGAENIARTINEIEMVTGLEAVVNATWPALCHRAAGFPALPTKACGKAGITSCAAWPRTAESGPMTPATVDKQRDKPQIRDHVVAQQQGARDRHEQEEGEIDHDGIFARIAQMAVQS